MGQVLERIQINMGDDVIITINGTDYYVPSNMVQYINDNGVSQYSSNFYGYSGINTSTNTYYPRITFRPQAYPLYQSANNINSTVLTNVTVEFSPQAQMLRFKAMTDLYSPFLLLVIAFFVMFRRFSR